jgi:hypothetical protein
VLVGTLEGKVASGAGRRMCDGGGQGGEDFLRVRAGPDGAGLDGVRALGGRWGGGSAGVRGVVEERIL